MSQENVELVRRSVDAFVAAGYDAEKFAEFFESFDPAIEYDISRTNTETQIYHGRDGVVEALGQWIDIWDAYEVEALEFIDAGQDRVVSVIRERGKVKDSDAWVEHTRGAVWTVRDQRIARYEEHQDRAEALEAAGLRE